MLPQKSPLEELSKIEETTRHQKPRMLILLSLTAYLLVGISCSSPKSDLRTMVPADSLVYIESDDLYKAVEPIVNNESFNAASASKPDLSALRGIQIAVAISGFQVSEEELNEENSIGKVQPKFVAVAETHAWGFQARKFTENELGEFINKSYGGGVKLETSDKPDGRYYVWTAEDGRKAFALVTGSLIFFGNDESAIERCQAVRRGEADPISKIVPVPPKSDENLAIGYIAPDGVSQLSNIAGMSVALGAGEEEDVKSFVARVLPQILRGSVKEVTWTAVNKNGRYEDHYSISLGPDLSKVFAETMQVSPSNDADVFKDAVSTTRYNLKDPQIAWRSALLAAQSKTDPLSGKLIVAFSSSLFEPYAIEDPEMFLSAVGNVLETVRFESEGDDVAVVARVKDVEKVKKSVAKEISFAKPAEKVGNADVWKSADGDYAAAFVDGRVVIGDADTVAKVLQGGTIADDKASGAPVFTAGRISDPAAALAEVLGERKSEDTPLVESYAVETRFTSNGIDRISTSDFGLIGTLIEQLGADEDGKK